MNVEFDFGQITTTEFGIGCEIDNNQAYRLVPVDADVQDALVEMAQATLAAMAACDATPSLYQPSEKYASQEYTYLPLSDGMASRLKELQEAENIPLDAAAMKGTQDIFCYFARITGKDGSRLTAVRRATQFKGILKSRVLRFTTDALKIVPDDLFKLDRDFDLLIDSSSVHVLRASALEFIGQLKQAILSAVAQNIAVLQTDVSFVDFAPIADYASTHARAARYLASIRSQKETRNVSKTKLLEHCLATGVNVVEQNGKIAVDERNVMSFLEVLDRRRYEVELVDGSPERFRASSRSRLSTQ